MTRSANMSRRLTLIVALLAVTSCVDDRKRNRHHRDVRLPDGGLLPAKWKSLDLFVERESASQNRPDGGADRSGLPGNERSSSEGAAAPSTNSRSSIIDTEDQWRNGGIVRHPGGGLTEIKKDGDSTTATHYSREGHVISTYKKKGSTTVNTTYGANGPVKIKTKTETREVYLLLITNDTNRDGNMDVEYRIEAANGTIYQSIRELKHIDGQDEWILVAEEHKKDDGFGPVFY